MTGKVTPVPDDLTTRLRANFYVGGLNVEAADRIKALEAELADAKRNTIRCHEAEIARDAVIAEALARSEAGAHSSETPALTLIAVRTILAAARVPQGVAETQAQRRACRQVVADSGGLLGASEPWTDPQVPGTGIRAALADLDRRGELPHGDPNGW